jgi:hypothetical protein
VREVWQERHEYERCDRSAKVNDFLRGAPALRCLCHQVFRTDSSGVFSGHGKSYQSRPLFICRSASSNQEFPLDQPGICKKTDLQEDRGRRGYRRRAWAKFPYPYTVRYAIPINTSPLRFLYQIVLTL